MRFLKYDDFFLVIEILKFYLDFFRRTLIKIVFFFFFGRKGGKCTICFNYAVAIVLK